MRIDMEQFLAVAVALGTAGAIGVAVYSQRGDDEPAAVTDDAHEVEPEPEPEPEVAASPPAPAPAPAVVPEPEGPPPLPAEPDEDFLKDPAIDGMPAPDVEGFG